MKQRFVLALCALAVGSAMTVACTPPPTGGGGGSTTTTTASGGLVYPAAGCYEHSGSLGDFAYTGAANTADNLVQFASTNGSCTGGATTSHDVLVVAATYDDADLQCAGLFFGITAATTLAAQGWSGFGPDAWYCAGS